MPSDPLRKGCLADSPGVRLKAARKALSMSQAKLAARIGIPQSTLSDYESGRYEAPRPALLALEYRFGINHRWVLHGEGEPIYASSPQRAWGTTGAEQHAASLGSPILIADETDLKRLETLE